MNKSKQTSATSAVAVAKVMEESRKDTASKIAELTAKARNAQNEAAALQQRLNDVRFPNKTCAPYFGLYTLNQLRTLTNEPSDGRRF